MARFLIRDDSNQGNGCVEKSFTGTLPRSKDESYVPWAQTMQGRVVYAPSTQYRNRASHPKLKPYSTFVSQERRRAAQTALGMLALNNPRWYQRTINKVSSDVRRFLSRQVWVDSDLKSKYELGVGKYMYSGKYVSFGRFNCSKPSTEEVWLQGLRTLESGEPIPSVLSIHDGVAAKLLPEGSSLYLRYQQRKAQLRPQRMGEIMNETSGRGRSRNSGRVAPTPVPGILQEGDQLDVGSLQSRCRGVDSYHRTLFPSMQDSVPDTARPGMSGVEYFRDLDTRNELFGAGPSGTTGTLLAASWAFSGLAGEEQREYMLAIIGYLIGGGMHSLHESLSIMRLLGGSFQYNSSSMLAYSEATGSPEAPIRHANNDSFPALPGSFTTSPEFQQWRDTYYDIVILGGIHWMHNGR